MSLLSTDEHPKRTGSALPRLVAGLVILGALGAGGFLLLRGPGGESDPPTRDAAESSATPAPRYGSLRVTADGRVRGCLFGNQEVDLKGALRSGGDDSALLELLRAAVCAKPQRHAIGSPEFAAPNRRMHGIGG